jgi:hypothetical protein
VIFKIFTIRAWVQTRSSEPSWARTRLRPPTSTPRPVESRNPTLVQVDDELAAARADQVDEQLTQPRRGVDIDLAPHVDDLDAVPGVVTQLQVHTSSSAMPGVIHPSAAGQRSQSQC